MDIAEARTLAEELLAEHVDPDEGWTVGPFANWKRKLAICDYEVKQIRLSRVYVQYATLERLTNTILHEIAHIHAGQDAEPHGAEWKAAARRLGMENPLAMVKLSDEEIKAVPFLYRASCRHGCEIGYWRRPAKRTVVWGVCSIHQAGLKWTDLRTGEPLMVR